LAVAVVDGVVVTVAVVVAFAESLAHWPRSHEYPQIPMASRSRRTAAMTSRTWPREGWVDSSGSYGW
jgi:hypothetical protein